MKNIFKIKSDSRCLPTVSASVYKGFTLIELLIVVAIIAILAAIAVPNFLEAQVRAKTSRAKADMRSINTAIESYRVDANKLPPHGIYQRRTNGSLQQLASGIQMLDAIILTTPVAYITSENMMHDPFQAHLFVANAQKSQFYEYPLGRLSYTNWSGAPNPNPTSVRLGDERFGGWRMLGAGPDQGIFNAQMPPEGTYQSRVIASKIVPYDPTNGTVSVGDIIRSGKGEIVNSYL